MSLSSILILMISTKAFGIVPRDKFCACLERLGVPPHVQHVVKAMHTAIYAKVGINGDTHDEVMSNIGVKQECPLSHTIWLVH